MKNLKFRAWDKSKKSMITDMVGFVIDPNKKRFRFFRINKSQKNGIGTDVTDLKNIIVMQFTGLTDINNKDIYEGDILKSAGIVAWNDVEVRWSCIDIDWNDDREWHDMLYLTTPLEIIGNIYEDKNLIK